MKHGTEAVISYQKLSKRKISFLIFSGILILLAFFLDLFIGSSNLSFIDSLKGLFNIEGSLPNAVIIMRELRLPVALMALLIGISLGTSGGVMQTILHNPLASPYTLGIGAGASFGASISIICNLGDAWTMVLAFLFAMLISTFIYLIGRFTKLSTHTMTLTGIGMLFLFQAGQGFIQYMASENQNQEIVFWTFGSLQKADYFKVLILFGGVIICLPLIYLNSWKYNSLLLGEEKAESLGINTNRIRIESLLLISILSSLAVCFTGPIGFIGLAGPHIGKILVGEDHRYYLPLSALAGGFILILADILSKVISPGSIFPVGIITSLIGVPFFFVVLLKGRKRA